MDKIKVFFLSNKKYFVVNEDYKNFIIANLKRDLIYVKTTENTIIIDIDTCKDLEIMETLVRMIKYGFNNARGWKFTNIYLSLKDLYNIEALIVENQNLLSKYVNMDKWKSNLNKCIELEKERHRKTTCFICCKKGHFAINCREEYDIDNVYIGMKKKCKYCNKLFEGDLLEKHMNNCKIYYSS